MIIRRFGNKVQSVTPDFDPAALTEVGFRRNGEQQWDTEDFEEMYELVQEAEIVAEMSHAVQEQAERGMLEVLEARLNEMYEGIEDGHLLSVQNQQGADYPRTRYERSTMGDLEFTYSLDKPLRLGVWRKKG